MTAGAEHAFIFSRKDSTVRRLRRHPLYLLAIALALPLTVPFLYYDFYDDSDLVCRKQISMADNGDLLHFLRKNPRVFVAVDQPFQSAGTNPCEVSSFLSALPPPSTQTTVVLRC